MQRKSLFKGSLPQLPPPSETMTTTSRAPSIIDKTFARFSALWEQIMNSGSDNPKQSQAADAAPDVDTKASS